MRFLNVIRRRAEAETMTAGKRYLALLERGAAGELAEAETDELDRLRRELGLGVERLAFDAEAVATAAAIRKRAAGRDALAAAAVRAEEAAAAAAEEHRRIVEQVTEKRDRAAYEMRRAQIEFQNAEAAIGELESHTAAHARLFGRVSVGRHVRQAEPRPAGEA
ncbi:MAG: hypothetical protein ACFCVE_06600 [Phycisphaerae bacterium]